MGFVNLASPGWGLGWVCLGTVCGVVPLVSAVCGVRGWASISACFWDVCGSVGVSLAPRRFRFRRAVWACVLGPGLGCAQPFLAGLSGCVLCAFVFSFVSLFFLFSRLCGPCPSIPFLSGWAGGSPFFFFRFSVPSPRGPLSLAWCCRFWVGGPPVPLWGSCLRCLLGGGLAACGGVGGRFGGCGLFSCLFPLPPPFFFVFFGGGLACSSLCLLWAGARTGLHSVLSSGLLSSVAFCVAAFRPRGSGGLCTRWALRPFLPGLVLAPPACGFGLGGWGYSCPFPSAVPAVFFWVVRHRCRLARCGPVCGLRCWCVARWRGAPQGVRWLASVSPSG